MSRRTYPQIFASRQGLHDRGRTSFGSLHVDSDFASPESLKKEDDRVNDAGRSEIAECFFITGLMSSSSSTVRSITRGWVFLVLGWREDVPEEAASAEEPAAEAAAVPGSALVRLRFEPEARAVAGPRSSLTTVFLTAVFFVAAFRFCSEGRAGSFLGRVRVRKVMVDVFMAKRNTQSKCKQVIQI